MFGKTKERHQWVRPAAKVRSSGPERSEAEWLASAAAGDVAAFESLYRCYYPRLMRFFGGMASQASMVDELVNDTLLTVWDKAATFTATSKVSTWIFGIAYRKGLQGLRETDLPVEFDADTEEDSSELGPASQLEQQQLKKAVADGLQALSVEHRMVVTLTYFHGAGYREIAEIMDCPVDTVKTRMFHARRRLQRLLRDLEGDRP